MNNTLLSNISNNIKKNRDFYKIIFTNEENKDVEYEVVATFKSKSRKKIYYLLTDNERNKDNSLKISAYYINYDENGGKEIFYPVVDDQELKMVWDVFNKIQNEIR